MARRDPRSCRWTDDFDLSFVLVATLVLAAAKLPKEVEKPKDFFIFKKLR
jgi:hypothetical protein